MISLKLKLLCPSFFCYDSIFQAIATFCFIWKGLSVLAFPSRSYVNNPTPLPSLMRDLLVDQHRGPGPSKYTSPMSKGCYMCGNRRALEEILTCVVANDACDMELCTCEGRLRARSKLSFWA